MKKKQILVAGGAGLLGSSLTNLLSKDKRYSLTSSYLNTKPIIKFKKNYKRYDFLKYEDCLKATKKKDLVIIAAVKSGGIKHLKENPSENLIDNIKIRINLFDAALKNNVSKIIWVSSSTVYQPSKKKISEKKINFNYNPYPDYLITGNVYRFLENIVNFYKSKGVDVCVVRTSSIYGPYDNFNPKKSHVIPALIKKAQSTKNKLEVWGDPDVIRDFVYVDDLVNGILNLLPKTNNQIFNFSSGKSTSIRMLAKTILEVIGSNKKILYKFKNRSSAPFRVLNNNMYNNKIKNIQRTSLKKGIKETYLWYKKNYF